MSRSQPGPMHAVHIKPVYTVAEFCREFGIGRSFAYEEMRAKRLRSFKVGAATRIAGEDALAWREAYRSSQAA